MALAIVGALLTLVVSVLLFKRKPRRSPAEEVDERLRRRRYTRPTPPPFPNGWIPVMESTELAVGQVKRLDVFGEDLVAFRTDDGVAHVLDAYCPHLGAHLGVMGRVVGDCIECPFHGWRFQGDTGACTHVPYASKVPEFVKIKKWTTEEVLGLLFVWYHAESEPPSWRVSDVPEVASIDSSASARWRAENHISCHIQELAENAADVAHFDFLHGPSFLATGENFFEQDETTMRGSLLRHFWQTNWEPRDHTAQINVVCRTSSPLRWLSRYNEYRFCVTQIGPALVVTTMRTAFGNVGYVLSLTPMKPFHVRAVHRYFPDRSMPRIFFWIFIWASKGMFERDIFVWNHKSYMKSPALVKEDRTIMAFRKWFAQFYSPNSLSWKDVRDKTLQW
ncbi:cholesterol 7-desaturase nvd-like [Dermacentor albipictus]|uniref:cholesterol 7-desaturase nvd-like n=1 Tax=Dermacentor albipictus TaxID=60249 RepID=UPI0038FC2B95